MNSPRIESVNQAVGFDLMREDRRGADSDVLVDLGYDRDSPPVPFIDPRDPADIAREQARAENALTYGLTGMPPELSPQALVEQTAHFAMLRAAVRKRQG